MKIELKNIKFSEAMSEETNAFTADLFINGKKVGYCRNQGHGGCTDYNGYNPEDRKTIAEAEAHFKAMPKYVPEGYNFELQPTLEGVIDDLLEDWLKAKQQKKMERKMKNCVLVGVPNGCSYSAYKFKMPLSDIPETHLLSAIERIRGKMKPNEVILNTNLQELGIEA